MPVCCATAFMTVNDDVGGSLAVTGPCRFISHDVGYMATTG
jgi:hypothetical protein